MLTFSVSSTVSLLSAQLAAHTWYSVEWMDIFVERQVHVSTKKNYILLGEFIFRKKKHLHNMKLSSLKIYLGCKS